MKNRAKLAASRIERLIEEFSAEELSEALSMLGENHGNDHLSYLRKASADSEDRRQPSHTRLNGTHSSGRARALLEIKDAEPEKFRLISEFEKQVQEGQVLKTLDEFRAIGRVIGKEFTPGKSRKEALGNLVSFLVQMDVPSIQAVLTRLPALSEDDETAFQRLANHIIGGAHK